MFMYDAIGCLLLVRDCNTALLLMRDAVAAETMDGLIAAARKLCGIWAGVVRQTAARAHGAETQRATDLRSAAHAVSKASPLFLSAQQVRIKAPLSDGAGAGAAFATSRLSAALTSVVHTLLAPWKERLGRATASKGLGVPRTALFQASIAALVECTTGLHNTDRSHTMGACAAARDAASNLIAAANGRGMLPLQRVVTKLDRCIEDSGDSIATVVLLLNTALRHAGHVGDAHELVTLVAPSILESIAAVGNANAGQDASTFARHHARLLMQLRATALVLQADAAADTASGVAAAAQQCRAIFLEASAARFAAGTGTSPVSPASVAWLRDSLAAKLAESRHAELQGPPSQLVTAVQRAVSATDGASVRSIRQAARDASAQLETRLAELEAKLLPSASDRMECAREAFACFVAGSVYSAVELEAATEPEGTAPASLTRRAAAVDRFAQGLLL